MSIFLFLLCGGLAGAWGPGGWFGRSNHHHEFIGSHRWGPVQPEEAAGTASPEGHADRRKAEERRNRARTTRVEKTRVNHNGSLYSSSHPNA